MISTKSKLTVVSILDANLGYGYSLPNDEQSHHCPFCHHRKRKLQINLITQEYHCWVCNAKGKGIGKLLRRIGGSGTDIKKIVSIYGDGYISYNGPVNDYGSLLKLPEEFKSMVRSPKSIDIIYNQAKSYLNKRKIDLDCIKKYNIGYCDSGLFGGRIIIPSYDSNNELNYFTARSFYDNTTLKYKNPKISRDVIVFENQINWNAPIVLVEGMFDAIGVRRNAIPLMGKQILPNLMNAIFNRGVKEIHLMLDLDAISQSTEHIFHFMKNGISVKNIIPNTNSDAADLGRDVVHSMIDDTEYSSWESNLISLLKHTPVKLKKRTR